MGVNLVKCSLCQIPKHFSKFSRTEGRLPNGKPRKGGRCKTCKQEYIKGAKLCKPRELVRIIYSNQRNSSITRGFAKPNYTLRELRTFCLVTYKEKFMGLWDNWLRSGHNQEFTPSIDRIDPVKGYRLDNIQLMTWAENRAKMPNDKLILQIHNEKSEVPF